MYKKNLWVQITCNIITQQAQEFVKSHQVAFIQGTDTQKFSKNLEPP